MNLKKIIILIVIVLGILGCKEKEEKLIVGMELAYPPFEMTNEKGEPSGISVDLAYAIGEKLGKKVQIENIAWSGLIPSLKTKKVDMILSSMTITKEREKTVDFSIPYSKSYLSLLVNKKSPVNDIESLNVKGRKIAVKKGTTGHIFARENLPNTEIMVFDQENACVLEVIQGKADAFIYDQMTIFKNWENNKETTKAILKPFQKDFEYWGIAFREDDDALREKVNKIIIDYKKSGGFTKLAEKHLSEQKKVFDEMGIDFFF